MVTKRLSVSNECQAFSPILKTATAFAIAGVTALALGSTAVRATVLFSDSFPGTSGLLTGTTPAITQGNATWGGAADTGSTSFNADGSVAFTTTGNVGNSLSYTPVTGGVNDVYTLSATLDPTGGNNGWVGIGFGTDIPSLSQGPSVISHPTSSATAATLVFFVSGSIHPTTATKVVTPGETATIVLDTTATNWVASYYYNNALIESYTYGVGTNVANPSGITGVAIGANNGSATSLFSGKVGSFELQTAAPVPEPATLGLFALGGMGLLLAGRKMRRSA